MKQWCILDKREISEFRKICIEYLHKYLNVYVFVWHICMQAVFVLTEINVSGHCEDVNMEIWKRNIFCSHDGNILAFMNIKLTERIFGRTFIFLMKI